MYRTGDLARRSANGRLECLGRVDSQVKIRGYRIELGEIESVLNGQPGVIESVVVAREIEGDRRLIAFVAGAVDTDRLRAGLRAHLPDYMIPALFVPMETLPRTPNNKIDRNGLATPATGQLLSRSSYSAPRTATEQRVVEAFERVLSVQSVGRDHNFFELGGHSLLITKVATFLREQLGVDLPIRAVFEAPTVAGLAQYVDMVLWSAIPSAEEPASSDDDRVRITL
jgi:acyl carrier protein